MSMMRAQTTAFRAPTLRPLRQRCAISVTATAEPETKPDTKAEETPKPAPEQPKPAAAAAPRGGTVKSEDTASQAASAAASTGGGYRMQVIDGYFKDDRWINGTWDFKQFPGKDGETDWNAVIDAEMSRRKMLEDSPIPSRNDDPVNFDTNSVPWWAWVKRFHLPEAEKLNGRAAMVGYLLAGLTELASGAGLVEQQESFFGKVLLHITVFGILLIRQSSDLEKYKNLLDEATFYDKQWNASWEGQVRPSEKESSK